MVQNFKMGFSKAIPEAFCVTLFNSSHDNNEVKSHAYLYAAETVNVQLLKLRTRCLHTLQAKSLSPPLEFSNFEIPNFLAIDRCENPSAARISILTLCSIDNCFFLAIL